MSQKTTTLIQHIKALGLSQKECAKVIEYLNDYAEDKSVVNLVKKLISLLQPVEYLSLLKDIRHSIRQKDQPYFDKLINIYLYGNDASQNNHSHRKTHSALNATEPRYVTSHGNKWSFKVINIEKVSGNVGLFLCGKIESIPGLKVGYIDEGSIAHTKGVKKGDYIIEVNGKSMEKISLKTALAVLPLLTSLKLIIKRPEKIIKTLSTSLNPWTKEKIYPTTTSASYTTVKSPSQQTIKLVRKSFKDSIGFSIRGGNEYLSPIYVSGVDKFSIAESSGLKVGDCILSINGKDCRGLNHHEAVQFIQNNSHLTFKVKRNNSKTRSISHQSSRYCTLQPKASDKTCVSKSMENLSHQPKPFKSSTLRWKSTSDLYTTITPKEMEMDTRRYEKRWRNLLTVNEYTILKALLSHYKKNKDVESLVLNVVQSFNRNTRLELLNDIRNLVRDEHVERYDDLIRSQFDGTFFKTRSNNHALERHNTMPASLSKLWFQSNENGDVNDGFPTSTPRQRPRNNVVDNSGHSTDPRSVSASSGYRGNRYHTMNERNRHPRNDFFDYAPPRSHSVEQREHSDRPTHLKTKRERDQQRSKSLKARNECHYRESSIDSSFNTETNWILKKPNDNQQRHQNTSYTASSRRHVGEIFPTVGDDVRSFEMDSSPHRSYAEHDQNNNANNYSPSGLFHAQSFKVNPIHQEDHTSTGYLQYQNDSPLSHRRHKSVPDLSNVDHYRSSSFSRSPSYKDHIAAHNLDIQVAPQKPTRGRPMKLSDDQNKYTIQLGSSSMTIESVTVHKPSQITRV
ncbi:whirlin-like [Clytia hemisphaerica]